MHHQPVKAIWLLIWLNSAGIHIESFLVAVICWSWPMHFVAFQRCHHWCHWNLLDWHNHCQLAPASKTISFLEILSDQQKWCSDSHDRHIRYLSLCTTHMMVVAHHTESEFSHQLPTNGDFTDLFSPLATAIAGFRTWDTNHGRKSIWSRFCQKHNQYGQIDRRCQSIMLLTRPEEVIFSTMEMILLLSHVDWSFCDRRIHFVAQKLYRHRFQRLLKHTILASFHWHDDVDADLWWGSGTIVAILITCWLVLQKYPSRR